MKKITTLLICIFVLLTLVGCSSNKLEKPETNLEFWIGENVDDVDFSKYQEKYGLMGGREYYGTGYIPTLDENGEQIDPEYYVIYTVSSYPDYSSKAQHITHIEITDPNVNVWGLTVNSTHEEVCNKLAELGEFEFKELGGNTLVAKSGKYTLSFSTGKISMRIDITNRQGIVF